MTAVPAVDRTGAPALEAVQAFLYREARLLDEQRWEEWAALFTADGEYWVPAAPDQPDPQNHVSLIYETGLLRAVRIKRFRHPNAFSLQPKPRTVHFVSNVMLDSHDESNGVTVASSRLIMVQYRRGDQDVFAAACTHHLFREKEAFRIAMKRVDLVNCDAPLGNILVYF